MNALAKHRAEVESLRRHPGMVFDEDARAAVPVEFPKVSYQVESWLDVVPELRLLFDAHWREIALDHDAIKLDPDYERYEALAKAGILHVVTARAGGRIVGYHVSIIHGHLHYRTSLTCFTDIFYLKPEYRSGLTGYKLLKFFVASVRERGVQKVYMMTKLKLDLGPILERMGFKAIERTYSMVF